MSIKILPARLANQIAAGEVVERPASVVKELIENSLDAGATRIDIDIEQGGAKCIRIKDNGKGVDKAQLTLALSRHATSKISHLDDLEAIVSLGFRGEALASVSSVSRLTFTSKPAEQAQAWQAIAEGRDMAVNIQPAAHPQGTTVEVLDLFFNTPARRRFLKTEKTEFQHIDELIKRIALSRFDVAITLKHNNKVIRQYRAAPEQRQQEKRIAMICSEQFMQHAVHFEHADQSLKITGWVSDRLSPRSLADVQYCYINGRMIRDKLVNHAIKQVYAHVLPQGMFPGYIIYIECDAKEVDVNVHPSKHEVRFHQARWVHDFISSTLNVTLNDTTLLSHEDDPQPVATAPHVTEHAYQPPSAMTAENREPLGTAVPNASPAQHSSAGGGFYRPTKPAPLSEQQVGAYCDFVAEAYQQPLSTSPSLIPEQTVKAVATVMSFIDEEYVLLQAHSESFTSLTHNGLLLLSIAEANQQLITQRLAAAWQDGEVIAQPLLLPVRFNLESVPLKTASLFDETLQRLGFHYQCNASFIIVKQVPTYFRHAPIADILSSLFDYLSASSCEQIQQSIQPVCEQLASSLRKHDVTTPFSNNDMEPMLMALTSLSETALKKCLRQPNLSLLLQDMH